MCGQSIVFEPTCRRSAAIPIGWPRRPRVETRGYHLSSLRDYLLRAFRDYLAAGAPRLSGCMLSPPSQLFLPTAERLVRRALLLHFLEPFLLASRHFFWGHVFLVGCQRPLDSKRVSDFAHAVTPKHVG